MHDHHGAKEADRRVNDPTQVLRGAPSPELPGLAFSRPKNKFVLFVKLVGFEIFDNLLSSWPFLRL